MCEVKGLGALLWPCVQNELGGFTTLPVSGFPKQYWETRGLASSIHLAAGGVIDFTCIPAQNASNRIHANTGNYKILLS